MNSWVGGGGWEQFGGVAGEDCEFVVCLDGFGEEGEAGGACAGDGGGVRWVLVCMGGF